MYPRPTSHSWSDNRGISGHWCLQCEQWEPCQNRSEWAQRNMWPFNESKLLLSYSASVWDKTVSMKRLWESNRQQQSLQNDLKQKSCGIITKFQWKEIAIKLRNCHHKETQLVDKILYGRKREETQIMNPWGQLLTNQRHTPQWQLVHHVICAHRVLSKRNRRVMTRHSREASTSRRSYNPPEQKRQRSSMTAVALTAKCQWEPHKKHRHVKAAHRKAPERQKWKSSCLPWPAGKHYLFVDNTRISDTSSWTQRDEREGRESPLHSLFCRLYRKEINTSPRRTRLQVVKVSLCKYWRAALEKSRSNMVHAAGGEHTLPALRRARLSFFFSGLISAAPPAYLASQLAMDFWTMGPAFLSLDLVPDQPCHSTGVNNGATPRETEWLVSSVTQKVTVVATRICKVCTLFSIIKRNSAQQQVPLVTPSNREVHLPVILFKNIWIISLHGSLKLHV